MITYTNRVSSLMLVNTFRVIFSGLKHNTLHVAPCQDTASGCFGPPLYYFRAYSIETWLPQFILYKVSENVMLFEKQIFYNLISKG